MVISLFPLFELIFLENKNRKTIFKHVFNPFLVVVSHHPEYGVQRLLDS